MALQMRQSTATPAVPARTTSMAASLPSRTCDTLSVGAPVLSRRLRGSFAFSSSIQPRPGSFQLHHSPWARPQDRNSEDTRPLPARPTQLGKPTLCRISAMQPSIADDEAEAPSSSSREAQSTEDLLLSCTTFNVLAPIYKRLGKEEVRESSFREEWLPRNKKILRTLLEKKSSIICLQELWLENPELVGLYEDALRQEGYSVFKLPRTNNRGDGLLTAVREDRLQVVHHEDLHFNDSGDRVAQFLWLRSAAGQGSEDSRKGSRGGRMEMIVVNTHLLFPHDSTSSFIRLRQVGTKSPPQRSPLEPC